MRVYVDLDDTLIHAVYALGRGRGKRTAVDAGEGEVYHSLLRPSAHRFLEGLRGDGEVFMLTTATKKYAAAHNETFRLGFSEGEIVAREDYLIQVTMAYSSELITMKRRVCPEGWLVDNMPPEEEAARLKRAYLGIGVDRYTQVREFNGKDPEVFNREMDQIFSIIKGARGVSLGLPSGLGDSRAVKDGGIARSL